MTDIAASASKSTRKFAPPNYEEMPEALRETAEKALAQAKDSYAKARLATEQATNLLKDTYATAAKGVTPSRPTIAASNLEDGVPSLSPFRAAIRFPRTRRRKALLGHSNSLRLAGRILTPFCASGDYLP